MKRRISSFLRNESGATAIEYGLMAGLVAVALIFSFTLVGNSVSNLFDNGNAEVLEAQAAKIPH